MKKYLFVFLMLSVASAWAGTLKWIDEQGKVHYSDRPPVGIKADALAPASPPASAPAPARPLSEREAELKKAKQAKTEADERAAKQRETAEIEKSNCYSAQQNLYSLQSGVRMADYDANGERRFIDDDEREQRIAKAKNEVGKWCK